MITEVPAATPDTTGEEEPIVAVPGLPLVHVPPGVPSPNVIVDPAHTLAPPVITAGNGFMVTTAVAAVVQPPPVTL